MVDSQQWRTYLLLCEGLCTWLLDSFAYLVECLIKGGETFVATEEKQVDRMLSTYQEKKDDGWPRDGRVTPEDYWARAVDRHLQ